MVVVHGVVLPFLLVSRCRAPSHKRVENKYKLLFTIKRPNELLHNIIILVIWLYSRKKEMVTVLHWNVSYFPLFFSVLWKNRFTLVESSLCLVTTTIKVCMLQCTIKWTLNKGKKKNVHFYLRSMVWWVTIDVKYAIHSVSTGASFRRG